MNRSLELTKAILSRSFRESEEARALLFSYRKQISAVQLFAIWNSLELESRARKDDRNGNLYHFLFNWISLFWFCDFDRKMRIEIMTRVHSFPNHGNDFKLLIIRLYHNKNRPSSMLLSPVTEITATSNRLKQLSSSLIKLDLSSSLRVSVKATPNTSTSVYPKFTESSSSLNMRGSNSSSESLGREKEIDEISSPFEVKNRVSRSTLDEDFSSTFTNAKSVTVLPEFIRWTPREIASSLTLQFSSAFLKVTPLDFLIKAGWGGTHSKTFSALDEMIALFNKVSGWVVTEILNQSTHSGQLYILEKMIYIAQKCESLGNFDGALAILSGLNNFGIQRLKPLWDGLSDRPHTAFTNLDALFSPVNNFRSYNEALNTRKGPMVPYVGIILRDFTFIAENDALNNASKSGEINLGVGKTFWQKWLWIQGMHKEIYRLPVPPGLVDFIGGINVISNDDDIYSRSLAASPGGFTEMQRHNSQSSSSTIKTEDTFFHDQSSRRDRSASIGSRDSRASYASYNNPNETSSNSLSSMNSSLSLNIPHLKLGAVPSVVIGKGGEEVFNISPRERSSNSLVVKKKSKKALRHLRTLTVPRNSSAPFLTVDKLMEAVYASAQRSTEKGTLLLGGSRSCVVRASSLGSDLYWSLQMVLNNLDINKNSMGVMRMTAELGTSIGISDALKAKNEWLSNNPEVTDKMHYIASAPCQYAHQGWGRWRITSISEGLEEENFNLYFKIGNCFESDSWLTFKGESPHSSSHNVCHMTCGYASGYFSAVLGFKTEVVEIACRATGHKTCIFVASSARNIERDIQVGMLEHAITEDKLSFISKPFHLTSASSLPVQAPPSPSVEKFKVQVKPRSKSNAGGGLSEAGAPDPIEMIEEKCFGHRTSLFGGLYSEPTLPAVNYDHRPDIKHIFIRADSLSSTFFNYCKQSMGPESGVMMASKILFELGRSLGTSDMRYYSEEVVFASPHEKLYFLPHVLVESGWGRLTVHQMSCKFTKAGLQNMSLKLELTNSLEVAGWKQRSEVKVNSSTNQDSPTCMMISGYISGWISEAFGAPTVCVETGCSSCRKSVGSGSCQFVVSSTTTIAEDVKKSCAEEGVNGTGHLLGVAMLSQPDFLQVLMN